MQFLCSGPFIHFGSVADGEEENIFCIFFPSPSSPSVVSARATLPRKTIFSRTRSSSNPISSLTNLPCDDGGDNNNSSSIGMGRWRRRRGRVDEEEEEDAKVINDSGRRGRRRREEGQEEAFSFVLLFARLPGTGIRQVIATAFYNTCVYVYINYFRETWRVSHLIFPLHLLLSSDPELEAVSSSICCTRRAINRPLPSSATCIGGGEGDSAPIFVEKRMPAPV